MNRRARDFAAFSLIGGSVLLTSCTASPDPSEPVNTASNSPEDPLIAIEDPQSTDFVSTDVHPILHEQLTGPTTLSIETSSEFAKIRFYLSCAPEDEFTLTMGTFYSGTCASRFTNSGSIPIDPSKPSQEVAIEVSENTQYWIVSIPIE